MSQNEKEYYEPVLRHFKELLSKRGEVHLEITADGQFSNKLKEQVSDSRDIIFSFLKETRPDITGFVKGEYSAKFFVIEIKDVELKLEHIYQTKRYADLFEVYFAFLVSPREIPAELKKIADKIYNILSLGQYRYLALCQYDKEKNSIVDWFKENPIEKDYYWK